MEITILRTEGLGKAIFNDVWDSGFSEEETFYIVNHGPGKTVRKGLFFKTVHKFQTITMIPVEKILKIEIKQY